MAKACRTAFNIDALERPEDVFTAVLQLLGSIFLIEKGDIEPCGVVSHLHLGNVQTLADMGGAGRVHDHGLEAGRLVHIQLFDGHKFGAVFITSGKMADQIPKGMDI